ncbi:MAG: OmpA family protein [Alphaproteobacteria bacterium]|nr:OmpA family protein [Alphaproteobacteria bacterium]
MAKAAPVPMWVVTFADLMSILVCFFILLLSFSIMDVKKFHEVSGSMKEAFGIQKERLLSSVIELIGTLVLEYATNIQPVPIPTISSPNSNTTGASQGSDQGEEAESDEEVTEDDFDSKSGFEEDIGAQEQLSEAEEQALASMALAALREAIKAQEQASADMDQTLGQIQMALQREMQGRLVDVDKNYSEIVITFPDEVGFRTGSDQITDAFFASLNRLADVVKKVDGQIIVAGHTDNTPLNSTGRFRDNWALSAARAAAVVRHFATVNNISGRRLEAHGFGETRPVDSNFTIQGRNRNRRVEIILRKAGDGSAPAEGQRIGGTPPPPPVAVYPPGLLRAFRR